jgi:hypothetical protein
MDLPKMVKDRLTDTLIAEGADLVRRLDRTGPPVELAMWMLSPESETWKLLFAVKGVLTLGPRVFYKTVQRALNQVPKPTELSIEDVQLLPYGSPLSDAVGGAFKVGGIGTVGRVTVRNSSFNGFRIVDALIYRS